MRVLAGELKVDMDRRDPKGWTPLHWATYKREHGVFSELIRHGADAGVLNKEGQTPLHMAAWDGREGYLRAMIDGGVDLESVGELCVVFAARGSHRKALCVLFDELPRSWRTWHEKETTLPSKLLY